MFIVITEEEQKRHQENAYRSMLDGLYRPPSIYDEMMATSRPKDLLTDEDKARIEREVKAKYGR